MRSTGKTGEGFPAVPGVPGAAPGIPAGASDVPEGTAVPGVPAIGKPPPPPLPLPLPPPQADSAMTIATVAIFRADLIKDLSPSNFFMNSSVRPRHACIDPRRTRCNARRGRHPAGAAATWGD
jgi:hypothetical protein